MRSLLRRSFCSVLLLAAPAAAATPHDGAHHAHGGDSPELGPAQRELAFYERRLAATPDDTALLSRLAAAQLDVARASARHADYRAAEGTYRSWIGLDERSAGARVGLAYALIGQHRFAEALSEARCAAEAAPEHAQVWALLGDLHFGLGNYVEAELAYARLEADALTLQSLARVAIAHQQRGRFEEARQSFEDALEAARLLGESAPSRAWCRTLLGELALEHGDLDEARGQFTRALELDAEARNAALGLASVEARSGQMRAARARLEALAGEQAEPRFWIALADVLADGGDPVAADAWYARAEEDVRADLDDGDVGHLRELAEVAIRRGDAATAIAAARRDLAEVRHDSGAHETLAWALHAAGRSDEAVAPVLAALRPGPSSVRLLCRAAVILSAAGREREAEHFLRRAQAIRPSLDAATQLARTARG